MMIFQNPAFPEIGFIAFMKKYLYPGMKRKSFGFLELIWGE